MFSLTAPSATAMLAAGASLGLITTVTLAILLINQEFLGALDGLRARRLSRALRIVIAPLLIAFVAIVVARISELLS